MNKQTESLITVIFFAVILTIAFYFRYPAKELNEQENLDKASTTRALKHIAIIASEPHYVGSEQHPKIVTYLQNELGKLGLQAQLQKGYTLTEWGNLAHSTNVLARIPGTSNGKALLLLSHFDSAPHSASPGAADDASGVATLLEGTRALIHSGKKHKNDIIILFTDAEELGLNGAALFVSKHPWAKDVGVVLNFEARGTAGPSYMLMETNNSNAELVKAFSEANPAFPVASSLMYSIYKMMPNDTDLTVFREMGDIPGYNFAFIDDHFNYHSNQDDLAHLDHRSVSHQISYATALTDYFANSNLDTLSSDEDYVYFNIPFAFITYPFSWIWPIIIATTLLFVFFVAIGVGRRSLLLPLIGKGLLRFLANTLAAGALIFLLWKFLLIAYPEYEEILHGFTYNGHYYIAAVLALTLALNLFFYHNTTDQARRYSYLVGPIIIWILFSCAIAIYLPGAAFFTIPVLASVLMLGCYSLGFKHSFYANLLLSVPALLIFAPLLWVFPIGLGLKILFGSAVLLSLSFGLLLPSFGQLRGKKIYGSAALLCGLLFLILAHVNSAFTEHQRKPNSLVYYHDADEGDAYLATYDLSLDEWTKKALGQNPADASNLNRNALYSKYNSEFSFLKQIPPISLDSPVVTVEMDTIMGRWRHLRYKITPQRKINRYDIFAAENMEMHRVRANGAAPAQQNGSLFKRWGRKVLSYYVTENAPLVLEFSLPKNQTPELDVLESSFDLMQQKALNISPREKWMMPKPFVLTDAVIVKRKLRPAPQAVPAKKPTIVSKVTVADSIVAQPQTNLDSIP